MPAACHAAHALRCAAACRAAHALRCVLLVMSAAACVVHCHERCWCRACHALLVSCIARCVVHAAHGRVN